MMVKENVIEEVYKEPGEVKVLESQSSPFIPGKYLMEEEFKTEDFFSKVHNQF